MPQGLLLIGLGLSEEDDDKVLHNISMEDSRSLSREENDEMLSHNLQ